MAIAALSKYPSGSVRELSSIALPLALSLLSSYILLLSDRLFLARYSIEALEGCAAASGLYFLFQMIINRFASTIQPFVAEAYGAKKESEAVQYTWQMIWLALASPIIVIPIGLLCGNAFFQGTSIKHEAMTYLTYMLGGAVLVGIETTLSSFYTGIGQSQRVLKAHLIAHPCNIILNYVLIFGIPHWIPPLGITGAALGTLTTKGLTCALLWRHFYTHFSSSLYHNPIYRLCLKKITVCIHKALPRAIGQSSVMLTWNVGACLLIQAGGLDLKVLTYGTSYMIPILNDAMGLAVLSVASYLIGKHDFTSFPRLFRSMIYYVIGHAALMAIPLLGYPSFLIPLIIKDPLSSADYSALCTTSFAIWLSLVTNSIYMGAFMLITALKDMTFYLITHIAVGGILYYCAIQYFYHSTYWTPELFWIIGAILPLILAMIYYIRCGYQLKQLIFSHRYSTKQSAISRHT